MNAGVTWRMPEVLEREGITPYRLSKELAPRRVSRTTVYRWAKEAPALLDLELLAHMLWALKRISGKEFRLEDLLDIRPSAEPNLGGDADAESRASVLRRITSAAPTRYELRLAGSESRHVFCAFDALLYAHLLQEAVALEARPPVGAAFALTIRPDRPPAEPYWHSYVEPQALLPEAPGLASSRCPYLHVFERLQDAQTWHGALPADLVGVVSLIALAEAWERARALVAAMSRP